MKNPNIKLESVDTDAKDGKIAVTINCVFSFTKGPQDKPAVDVVIEKNISATSPQPVDKERPEKRIDIDNMSDPPISSLIAKDLSSCIEDIKSRQEGHELNCLVIGSFTANWACIISDSLPVAGRRVLCMGDCVSESGKADASWKATVGNRFGKTVFPVSGDIGEHIQGIDRRPDLIMLSVCGEYAEIATMINKWSGLVSDGGIVCGPQFDEEDYPATRDAIIDVFGLDKVEASKGSSFWHVNIQSTHVK